MDKFAYQYIWDRKKSLIVFLEAVLIFALLTFVLMRYVFPALGKHFTVPEKEQKRVALTFDIYRAQKFLPLLDTIEEENIRASVFFTGVWLEGHRLNAQPYFSRVSLMQRLDQLNVGTLSNSYIPMKDLNEFVISGRLRDGAAVIERMFEAPPRYVRPPEGYISASLAKVAREQNMKLVSWDINTSNINQSSSDEHIVQRIVEQIDNGEVIHIDDNERLHSLLPQLIQAIKDLGYEFATLSELDPAVVEDPDFTIDHFAFDGSGAWESYSTEPGMISAPTYSDLGYMRMDCTLQDQQWCGVYAKVDMMKRDWSDKEGLELDMFGYNSEKSFVIIIIDDGGERWSVNFADTWDGWRKFFVPFEKFEPYLYAEKVEDGFGEFGSTFIREVHILPQASSTILLREVRVR